MEKIRLLLYCTKQPLFLVRNECDGYFYTMDKGTLNDYKNVETYNGKVVAECDFEIEKINYSDFFNCYVTWKLGQQELLGASCLSIKQIKEYLGKENTIDGNWCGYAIHIKNLNVFDMPKDLSDYGKYDFENANPYVAWRDNYYSIEKAPQNMMYATDLKTGENYILISIRPEWLVKILNGEKTVEVRKKVLKEMITDA